MPSAETTITTTRPSRYLTQLCRHVDHLSRIPDHRPHLRRGDSDHTPPGAHTHVTWSDTAGTIDLGWGRCTLTTGDDALVLHAEAEDDRALQQLQAMLSARLHQFGRRDHLAITWQPVPLPAATTSRPHDRLGADRRLYGGWTVALIAVGVLIAAVHLGMGATVVGSPAWADWALVVVLAVVVVKLVVSVVLGHRLIRHRRPSRTRR